MISFWADRNHRNCFTKKSPLAFFTNLFKRKKYKLDKNNGGEEEEDCGVRGCSVAHIPTTLSVSVMDMSMTSPCPLSPALSTLTLTPGRTRDIDQDMEALRLSRQDNPFLQVLASRESLVESLFDSVSDDANLMLQEFPTEFEVDPLSLPEIHQHMIRSPPPTTWPKSPNYKVFQFPTSCEDSQDLTTSLKKSPVRLVSPRQPGFCSLQYNEFLEPHIGLYSTIHSTHSPRASIVERPHKRSSSECRGRPGNSFQVTKPTTMRSLSDVRRPESSSCDGSSHLVSGDVVDVVDVVVEEGARFELDSPLTLPLLAKRFT